MVPALVTVLDPFTRTLAKLGLLPALVCVAATVASGVIATARPVTPAGAMKAADAPEHVTVWPEAGVPGTQAACAPEMKAAQAGTPARSERRNPPMPELITISPPSLSIGRLWRGDASLRAIDC